MLPYLNPKIFWTRPEWRNHGLTTGTEAERRSAGDPARRAGRPAAPAAGC